MTLAPQTPPLPFGTIDEAIGAVRASGMRLSTARRLVLEALFAAEGPVSAVHLADTLKIDATSVYRNLEVLQRHGLIRHVHLGHGPGLYVLVGREELEYLYCEGCARVTPLTPDQLAPLREHLRHSFGYEVRFTHFALVGLCAGCAQRAQPSSKPEAPEGPVEQLHGQHHGPSLDHGSHGVSPHEHLHSHGDLIHAHPHAHADGERRHQH